MSDRKRFESLMHYYRMRVMESLGDKKKHDLAVDDLVSFFMEEINTILLKLSAAVMKSVNKVKS